MTKSVLDKILILIASVLSLAILGSILLVFVSIFSGDLSLLNHFFTYLFPRYIRDTFIVVFSVLFFSLILGTSLAFLIANFNFFGSKILNILLVLPLAIPAYVLAFIYVGIMEFDGIFKEIFGFSIPIFNIYGAIFVLAISLYPYIYLFARASFKSESRVIFDVGHVLGLNKFQVFYKIAIFITRPAIISGALLVIMETLSDYGTAAYMGVDTFSAGIFKLWFDLQDLGSSSILAAILILFIFLLMLIEHIYSKKKSYSLNSDSSRSVSKKTLSGIWNFLAFFYCLIVASLGFLIPFLWLLYWGLKSKDLFNIEFYEMAFNSFKVAAISAVLITAVAFFLNFAARISKSGLLKILILRCSSLGYALSGAAIGVSLMIGFSYFTKISSVVLLSVSIVVLITGYLVRFIATSILAFESGFEKISKNIDEAAREMKLGTWGLLKLHTPLLRHFFTLSFVIVFVDIVKELPLSLILRPFDFETLSIRAFFYATDERIYASALPSLFIVLIAFFALLYIELRKEK